jgi:hypothetical protein
VLVLAAALQVAGLALATALHVVVAGAVATPEPA